jgi:hypothetical protein
MQQEKNEGVHEIVQNVLVEKGFVQVPQIRIEEEHD